MTIPELSQRFEVSRRTISRDIDDICRAGIPIVTTQGYGGGIAIADGYKIDKTVLTKDEILLMMAGLKGLDSVSKGNPSQRLIEKLAGGGGKVIEAEDYICINLASHYETSLTQKIEALKQGIKNRLLVSFCYISQKGEELRVAEPYLLVFQWSSWYLYAYCLDKEDYRMFKLNRLWNLEVTDKSYQWRQASMEHDNFDCYFNSQPIHLKAVFKPKARFRLIEEYGMECFQVLEQGDLLFEWDFVSYSYMCQWILSFGDQAAVLEPHMLREDVMAQAENILKQQVHT